MIELTDVSKTFRTKKGLVNALDGCSLSIPRGEICGVIGYSGAGKSTLVRLINRLEKPDSGRVHVMGQDLAALDKRELRKLRQKIGMIFQHFNLLHAATVFDNIAAPLRNTGMGKQETAERVGEMLELVGLTDKTLAYPGQLSGGQKQRVAIARALACEPEILLCDEATSALDPNTTQSILELIARIASDLGLTVVVIAHQMEVVKALCSRVAVMDEGRIVEADSILTIFTHPREPLTREFLRQGNAEQDCGGWPHERPLYRLSFAGEQSGTPFLAQMMKRFDVTPNILSGNVQRLSGTPFGNLVMDLDGESDNVLAAVDYLKHEGVAVEVVG